MSAEEGHADNAKYAFAIYRGVIKEVYEIDKWLPATKAFSDFWVEKLRSQGRIITAKEHVGRSEFIGSEATDHIRKKYIGHVIPARHTGNPILSISTADRCGLLARWAEELQH